MGSNLVPFVWLGITVVFGLVEAASPTLVCIWFCLGAAVAFVVSLLTANLLVQILVFVLASAVMLVCLRPFFRRRATLKGDSKTDVDALVGRRVTVSQAIPAKGRGRALLADTSWLASSADGAAIPAGTAAVIARVDGARLIVAPADPTATDPTATAAAATDAAPAAQSQQSQPIDA